MLLRRVETEKCEGINSKYSTEFPTQRHNLLGPRTVQLSQLKLLSCPLLAPLRFSNNFRAMTSLPLKNKFRIFL